MFILFRKTDFNTILTCLWDKVYRCWCHNIFVVAFLLSSHDHDLMCVSVMVQENMSKLVIYIKKK